MLTHCMPAKVPFANDPGENKKKYVYETEYSVNHV